MGSDTTENSEYALHEEGWLNHAAIKKVGEIVYVRDVVAFELKTRTVFAARRKDSLDISERIPKYQVAAIFLDAHVPKDARTP